MSVHNLVDALAVHNGEKGGAMYPLEPRESPFGDLGVNVRVLWPGEPRGDQVGRAGCASSEGDPQGLNPFTSRSP